MRSLVLDELLPAEVEAVRAYLAARAKPSGLDGLYWIFLEPEQWGDKQRREHRTEKGADAYRLAVELGPDWVRFEFLVRAEGLHNLGGGQADEAQSLFLLRWAEEMARNLNLTSCL